MSGTPYHRTLLAAAVLLAVLLFPDSAPARVDHSIWAELLKKHVDYETGRVDYTGFKQEEDRLDEYLKILETTDSSELSEEERLAFYINVYNSATVKLILDSYPWHDSIRDIGDLFSSPFEEEFIVLEGRTYSLDDIEHGILRPEFKDARIHFAVNCASRSCPPLYDKPYVGPKIDEQLDAVTRNFINDPDRTWVEEDTLHVTRIMDWYSEDFEREGGVVAFVKKYAEGDLEKKLAFLGGGVEVAFQDYDWTLNDVDE